MPGARTGRLWAGVALGAEPCVGCAVGRGPKASSIRRSRRRDRDRIRGSVSSVPASSRSVAAWRRARTSRHQRRDGIGAYTGTLLCCSRPTGRRAAHAKSACPAGPHPWAGAGLPRRARHAHPPRREPSIRIFVARCPTLRASSGAAARTTSGVRLPAHPHAGTGVDNYVARLYAVVVVSSICPSQEGRGAGGGGSGGAHRQP